MIPFLQVWDLSLEDLYCRNFEKIVSLHAGLSTEREPLWIFRLRALILEQMCFNLRRGH